ncbi:MAG: DUF1848 domain-containing protein [Alphaproteobacteria bacterium]
MIVSASYRTDIPAYYGDWFKRRLAAGYVDVHNPYGGKPYRVELTAEAVSGFVFWTRNPQPFESAFAAVQAMERPFIIQMTITGYPRVLEAGVLDRDPAVAAFQALARLYGRDAVVWRYDPVIITDATPPAWHENAVAQLAKALREYTTECVLSFAHIYRKTRRNLEAGAIGWRDPVEDEKKALLGQLAAIIRNEGLMASLCAQPTLLGDGLTPARCIDAARLSSVAGRAIAAKTKGARPGCLCADARDIGRYDRCPQGCVYCYANANRETARTGLQRHDPDIASL